MCGIHENISNLIRHEGITFFLKIYFVEICSFCRIDHKDRMIKVATKQTVAMKENNIISPYVFKKVKMTNRHFLSKHN